MILLEITKIQRHVQKKECADALSEYFGKNVPDMGIEEKTFVYYGTRWRAVFDTYDEGEVHAIMEN